MDRLKIASVSARAGNPIEISICFSAFDDRFLHIHIQIVPIFSLKINSIADYRLYKLEK